jgi:hypothetical protein
MNISTQTLFMVFFTLAVSLVLTLVINRVRRWRQRDEEQIREAEYEDAIRKSQVPRQEEPVDPPAVTSSVLPVVADSEPVAASVPVGQEPEASTSADSAESAEAGVIQADQFMAWSLPEADVWQPPVN